MSPEQARGRRVTKRTDVWAFGCVLYEMLTGRRAFSGDTITDTLAAVLHQDVDWAALPATTPPAVRRLLMRCLQKDEKNRLHDIADARLDVEDALADAGGTPVALTSPPESGPHQPPGWILDGTATATAPLADRWSGPQFRPREWAALTVASLAIIAAGMMAFIHFRKPAPTAEAVEFAMYPPDSLQLAANLQAGATPQYAVSPDGQQIAFVASSSETVAMIWVRPLSTTTARPVPGTERGGHPFWCPDNRTLGFLQMAS
jgi:serine/threonine protein kinase